jgi:hypothetical protein
MKCDSPSGYRAEAGPCDDHKEGGDDITKEDGCRARSELHAGVERERAACGNRECDLAAGDGRLRTRARAAGLGPRDDVAVRARRE